MNTQLQGYNIDDLPQTLTYNGDGTLNYIEVTIPGNLGAPTGGTYRKTFTYTSGNCTGVSAWVKQ